MGALMMVTLEFSVNQVIFVDFGEVMIEWLIVTLVCGVGY